MVGGLDDDPALTELRIQSSIWGQLQEEGAPLDLPAHQDAPVGRDRETPDAVGTAADDVDGEAAICAEGGVDAAVRLDAKRGVQITGFGNRDR